jgi:hypothetical protein
VRLLSASCLALATGCAVDEAAPPAPPALRPRARVASRPPTAHDHGRAGEVIVELATGADPEILAPWPSEPLFTRPAAALAADKAEGEAVSGDELADLTRFHRVRVPDVAAALDALQAMPEVAEAHAAPELVGLGAADLPPTTDAIDSQQGYLDAAPGGLDARYAWTVPGGRGRGVRVIDVGIGWQLDHEDLPSLFYVGGSPDPGAPSNAIAHGTSTLGEIAAPDNGYGVTGVANQVDAGVQYVTGTNVADAIDHAAAQLRPGDVIDIEIQVDAAGATPGHFATTPWVPAEYDDATYAAIATATARGIVVVELAGNGDLDLGAASFGGRFDRAVRDSGAILVGGGEPPGYAAPLARHPGSDYGARVDVQGWYVAVVTTGGTATPVLDPAGDPRQAYGKFSGTSSATPMVAGAVADLEGIARSRGQILTPSAVRALLVATGTPSSGAAHIGPQPDLRAAIAQLGAPGALLGSGGAYVASLAGASCVDVQGGGTFGWLQMYGCKGSANQLWRTTTSGQLVGYAGGCVDVPGATTASGTQVQTYACTGGANQRWLFAGAKIKALGGTCLDVTGGSSADGTPVQTYACTSGSNQSWDATAQGELRALGKCLTWIDGGGLHARVVLSTCTGAASQVWRRDTAGELVSSTNLCVDVPDASIAPGVPLQLYTCHLGDNQRFTIRGALHGLGGLCLNAHGASTAPGTPVENAYCDGGAGQTWMLVP